MALKILIAVLALGAVGGGAWYVSTTSKTDESLQESASVTSETEAGTFANLFARAGSWKCDAKATHEEGASEGTVYLDGGKIRGDFVASMNGQTVATNFISMDGFMYTWSDMLPQGMKVKMDAAGGTSGGQGIDPTTPVEYTCEVWIPDQSKFTLPEMEFFEIGSAGMGGFNTQFPR